MSRFYRGPEADYVNDFIYQPPWEMFASALAKKEGDIQQQANQMEMLRNLPIEYMEKDKVHVDRIKEELDTEIDGLSTSLTKDLLNPQNKAKLQQLSRDIQKRYTSGDIYNIQKTKENVTALEEKIAALEDPYVRDTYRKNIIDSFWQGEDNTGSVDSPFSYDGELYNNIDFLNDFAGSEFFAALGKDDIEKAWSNLSKDKRFIETGSISSGGLEAEKLQTAVKDFLEQQHLQGFGADREKNFNQKWYDEEGKMDFKSPDAEPKKIFDAVLGFAYKTQKSSARKTTNQYEFENYKQRQAASTAQRIQQAAAISGNSSAEALYLTEEGGKILDVYRGGMRNILESAGTIKPGENLTNEQLDGEIDSYKAALGRLISKPESEITEQQRNSYRKAQKQVVELQAKFNTDERTGFGQLLDAFGGSQKDVAEMQKVFKVENAATEISKYPGYVEILPGKGGLIVQNAEGRAQRYTLKQLEGLPLDDVPGYEEEGMEVGRVLVQEGSAKYISAGSYDEDRGVESGAKITAWIYPNKKGQSLSTEKVKPGEIIPGEPAPIPISYFVGGNPLNIKYATP